MTHPIALYMTSNGLSGCYMPDSYGGPMTFATRRELASAIRYEIEFHDFPKSSFSQVNIKRLWAAIKRAGSASCYHFNIAHKGYEIAFHGLTQAEFEQQEAEND